jgi:hypothetical protein
MEQRFCLTPPWPGRPVPIPAGGIASPKARTPVIVIGPVATLIVTFTCQETLQSHRRALSGASAAMADYRCFNISLSVDFTVATMRSLSTDVTF